MKTLETELNELLGEMQGQHDQYHWLHVKNLKAKLVERIASLEAAFDDRCRVIAMQLEDKQALQSKLEHAVLEINHRGDELSELRAELSSATGRLDSIRRLAEGWLVNPFTTMDASTLSTCAKELLRAVERLGQNSDG